MLSPEARKNLGNLLILGAAMINPKMSNPAMQLVVEDIERRAGEAVFRKRSLQWFQEHP